MSYEIYFTKNRFQSYLNSRRKLVLTFTTDHALRMDSQKADPDINMLYLRSIPVFDTYRNRYSLYEAIKGYSRGETSGWEGLLDSVPEKLHRMTLKIELVFPKGSPEYIGILPDGVSAMNKGAYAQRINVWSAFVERLSSRPELKAVHDEAAAFLQLVSDTRQSQQGKGISLDAAATDLDAQQVLVCQTLYGNLGYLMYKYQATPEKIDELFDFSLLHPRKHAKTKAEGDEENSLTLTVPPASVVVAEISFTDETKFSFYNSGNVNLGIFTASQANAAVPSDVHILPPDEELVIKASQLGAAGSTFLLVNNAQPTTEGELEIDIVE